MLHCILCRLQVWAWHFLVVFREVYELGKHAPAKIALSEVVVYYYPVHLLLPLVEKWSCFRGCSCGKGMTRDESKKLYFEGRKTVFKDVSTYFNFALIFTK